MKTSPGETKGHAMRRSDWPQRAGSRLPRLLTVVSTVAILLIITLWTLTFMMLL